jgi:hypothetical protein
MEDKIKLLHPGGKNAVKIDRKKYEILNKAILHCLAKKDALTHTEMFEAVKAYFEKNKIVFEGSVQWYMESVKLHLEATKAIQRITEKIPHKWKLNNL